MKSEENRIKIALGTIPKAGGTYTFYRNLRAQLQGHGFDVYSVTVGAAENELVHPGFINEGCVFLADNEADLKKQAQVFAQWCEDVHVDIVIAINSEAIMAALPHLPERVRVVSRVASIFDSGCRNVMTGDERLAKIVITAPGQKKALVEKYGADEGQMVLIPNGVDPTPYERVKHKRHEVHDRQPNHETRGNASTTARSGCEKSLTTIHHQPSANPALRLGFLGRLEHISKGVLFIPDILKHLDVAGVEFHLTIAGKGVYERGLKRLLKRYVLNGSVEFTGELPPEETPEFLSQQDVLLFTSQSEGCPNTLIEGIMAGCVPVVWRLEGITDFIVQDGHTGFVCPLGECGAFAEKIAFLSRDRELLAKMSVAGAADGRERFSLNRFGDAYASLFRGLMGNPAPAWESWSWARFESTGDDVHRLSRINGPLVAGVKKCLKRGFYVFRLSHRWE